MEAWVGFEPTIHALQATSLNQAWLPGLSEHTEDALWTPQSKHVR